VTQKLFAFSLASTKCYTYLCSGLTMMVVHLVRASVIARHFAWAFFMPSNKILAVAISYNSYSSSERCIIVKPAGCAAVFLYLCHGSSVDGLTMMQYAKSNRIREFCKAAAYRRTCYDTAQNQVS